MNTKIESPTKIENDRTFSIANVHVRIVDQGTDGLIAWASCVVSDSIRLDNIAVRRSRDGQLFLTYPAKLTQRGTKTHYFNPISPEASKTIENAVFARLATLARTAETPKTESAKAS